MHTLRRLLFVVMIVLIDGAVAHAQPPEGPGKTARPAMVGEASLHTYSTPGGAAEAIAKLLQEVFPGPQTRIKAAGSDTLIVWADAQTHRELAKQRVLAPPIVEIVPLTSLDALKAAELLKATLGRIDSNKISIVADAEKNVLILRGNAEQVQEARRLLVLIGNEPGQGNLRSIRLEKGAAVTVAEAVQQLIRKLRPDNDVKLIVPGGPDTATPKTKEPEKKDAKLAKKGHPVTLTAFGDRLIVATEDREAMELVVQIVRMLVNTESGGPDFEVIRLVHARATHVAQILEETFNQHSTRQNFGGGGGGRGPGPGPASFERIRVVADPLTNTLILRASPLDRLVILRLLERALDTPEAAEFPEKKKERTKK